MSGLRIALILLTGLALSSILVTATGSSTLFNDTGSEAHGLRVVFEQPVTIVRMGAGFASWSPKEDGVAIVFSDGEISPWGDFYFYWKPADAKLVSHQWLLAPPGSDQATEASPIKARIDVEEGILLQDPTREGVLVPVPCDAFNPPPTLTPALTATEYVNEGIGYLRQGKPLLEEHETGGCAEAIQYLRTAIEKCSEALKLNPECPDAYFCRGMARRWLEEGLHEAIEDLQSALNLGLAGSERAEAKRELKELRERVAARICVSMGPISFGQYLTEDGKLVNPRSTYSGCVKEVWVKWRLYHPCSEVLVVKWYRDSKHVCQHYLELEDWWTWAASGWTADKDCMEPGNWCVKVYSGDRLMTEGCCTVTPEPQATAPAGPVVNWPIVLLDSFNGNRNDWPVGPFESDWNTHSMKITNGVLRSGTQAKKSFVFHLFPDIKSDCTCYLAVDAKQIDGPADGRYGLVFRRKDASIYYTFRISNRRYIFGVRIGGKWRTILNQSASSAIRLGRTNKIAVVAEGSEFTFFITDVVIGLRNAGDTATFEFDNFELRTP